MTKPALTIDSLQQNAAAFADLEKAYGEPLLYGVTDGKAVGVGSSSESGASRLTVFRLNPDGSLDVGFGGSGIVANCISIAILLRVDYESRRLLRGYAE